MLLRTILLLVVVMIAGAGCTKPPHASPKPAGMLPTPGMFPPITAPAVKNASEANLPDDHPVVGIVVEGKARAYSLAALSPLNQHIVNDLIDAVPVTVTYCDLARCIRVYTADKRGETLDVMQVGRSDDGLMIRHQGRLYRQATGKAYDGSEPDLPLKVVTVEETTWKAWREKHPTTAVYTGPSS